MNDTSLKSPPVKQLKRKKPDSPEIIQDSQVDCVEDSPKPAWYVAVIQEFDGLIKNIDMSKQDSIGEVKNALISALEIGLVHDTSNKTYVESIIRSSNQMPETYASVAAPSRLLKPQVPPPETRKGPITSPLVLHKNQSFYFTIRLGPKDPNLNIKEVRKQVNEMLQPKKYNIRCDMRISKAGNIVSSFPTADEKNQSKKILRQSEKKPKLTDMDERMIPIRVKNIPSDMSGDQVLTELLEYNPILDPLNDVIKTDPGRPYVKWVGPEGKKKLRLLVPLSIAGYVLTNGFLYTSMMRHSLVRMNNLPNRCKKCLRLHFHRAENCSNPQACEFCTEVHQAGECPVKEKPQEHQCVACKHHVLPTHLKDLHSLMVPSTKNVQHGRMSSPTTFIR